MCRRPSAYSRAVLSRCYAMHRSRTWTWTSRCGHCPSSRFIVLSWLFFQVSFLFVFYFSFLVLLPISGKTYKDKITSSKPLRLYPDINKRSIRWWSDYTELDSRLPWEFNIDSILDLFCLLLVLAHKTLPHLHKNIVFSSFLSFPKYTMYLGAIHDRCVA